MKDRIRTYFILGSFVLLSFAIKLILIFKYGDQLTLSSDDLNYLKSAVYLLKKNMFVFHNYNEPTVFVMPLYPLFLSIVMKIFGYGTAGIQAIRVLQAVISCVTILMVFLIAKRLFDKKIALFSAFLVSFYFPNIVTAGYLLTETLFTALLYILLYYSLKFSDEPSYGNFAILGVLWAAAVLCRPTVAPYPVLLFLYLLMHKRMKMGKLMKLGAAMSISFIIIMSPWWVRNFMEYGEFIPLTAASGNPMLQGTYVNYVQTPENVVYYKLGENAFETNKIEVEIAKKRIREEFKKDFSGYLKWFTIGKTKFFWQSPFYWREFLNIDRSIVELTHFFLLTGFAGIMLSAFKDFTKYMLPISLIVFFNIIHCIYMAFDRYAFPLMPLMSIFCGYFATSVIRFLKLRRYAS
ncbi:MAG TPA: glycosyltransferase family 39 protein [Clostridiaceae bacterium]|nr:glycosyltransferase family 39 protein [Clostridiaceae bacterium]